MDKAKQLASTTEISQYVNSGKLPDISSLVSKNKEPGTEMLSDEQQLIFDSIARKSLIVIDSPQSTGKSFAVAVGVRKFIEKHGTSCIVFGQKEMIMEQSKLLPNQNNYNRSGYQYDSYGNRSSTRQAAKLKQVTYTELFGLKYDLIVIDGAMEEIKQSKLLPWVSAAKKLVVTCDSAVSDGKRSTQSKVKSLSNLLMPNLRLISTHCVF